eukprot:TRINITY_DN24546_c0_g1_i5.p1 TRINITY_DN24546_c0_g1~~TRINITY_DN24546_c0_g1_i5.p1  ORF type:complete len:342 (-),score=82.24 TRINITY_DN24546_c0_g1_i5:2093-3118(-)
MKRGADDKLRSDYVKSVCDTIRAGASVVGKMSGTLGPKKEVTQKVLSEAVEHLNQDVAKVGVLCGMGSASAWHETKALLDSVQQKVLILYSALHAMCSGHGAALKAMGHELANDLIDPLQRLIKLAAKETAEGDELNKVAGMVWHTAKNILKTPLTDRSAISKSMVHKITSIQDTLQEVQGMGKNRSGDEDKQNEEDEDDVDELVEEEIELARMSAKCIDHSLQAMKMIAKELIKGQDNMVNNDNLESWDSVLYVIGDIRRSIEEWGAALYPPQEDEIIQKNMIIIYNSMEELKNTADKIMIDGNLIDVQYLYTVMEDIRILMEDSVEKEEAEAAADKQEE